MKYVSECEAMQWNGTARYLAGTQIDGSESADEIVAWVNANGGEADYWRARECNCADSDHHEPRIAVRTINGWAYAAPGHYVVMGTNEFVIPARTVVDHQYWDNGHGQAEHAPYCKCVVREVAPARTLRDYHPCDPVTFERQWVKKEHDHHR